MRRPQPLSKVVTGHRPQPSGNQSLTPRTPHSRAGLAEEALGEIELEQIESDADYRSYAQQQAEPLLASSTSDSFPSSGYRSRGDDHDDGREKRTSQMWPSLGAIIRRIPLVLGIAIAAILLLLIVISVKRPEALEGVIGGKITSASQSNSPSPSQGAAKVDQSTSPADSHTISYMNYTKFPLLATEYRSECDKLRHGFMQHGGYWDPMASGVHDVPHKEETKDYHLFEGERTRVCNSTITYMLDGHVGLLADLALMSQAAALARERNRTFFVDDTYWNRGRWVDHFQDVRSRQPGPEPGCRAPPPEELVACPRLARHWVINSRTAKFHFGNGFYNAYEDPYSRGLNRRKPIFESALVSFTDTIRPNAQNAALVRSARGEFSDRLPKQHSPQLSNSHRYIGVHIRRGDRKAVSWKFHGNYVPISNYVQATQDTWSRVFKARDTLQKQVYVASDSPTARDEYINSLHSGVTVFSLAQSENPDLRALASPKAYVQKEFSTLKTDERINATRGMIVDFALLNGMWRWDMDIAPAATICSISSNVCRLSAVGLGWDRAFGYVDEMGSIDEEQKGWEEIDQKDEVVPVWDPFELF